MAGQKRDKVMTQKNNSYTYPVVSKYTKGVVKSKINKRTILIILF